MLGVPVPARLCPARVPGHHRDGLPHPGRRPLAEIIASGDRLVVGRPEGRLPRRSMRHPTAGLVRDADSCSSAYMRCGVATVRHGRRSGRSAHSPPSGRSPGSRSTCRSSLRDAPGLGGGRAPRPHPARDPARPGADRRLVLPDRRQRARSTSIRTLRSCSGPGSSSRTALWVRRLGCRDGHPVARVLPLGQIPGWRLPVDDAALAGRGRDGTAFSFRPRLAAEPPAHRSGETGGIAQRSLDPRAAGTVSRWRACCSYRRWPVLRSP